MPANTPPHLSANYSTEEEHTDEQVVNSDIQQQKLYKIILGQEGLIYDGLTQPLKIIESMAFKKTIIATHIAAEGIDCEHEENILIADSPEKFSELINKTLADQKFQERIGDNAFLFVNKNYNFTEIASTILNFIK